MEAPESVDERVAAARVVGNGCDGPRVASSYETSTRPGAPRANGRVKAAQSLTTDVLPARSTQPAHLLWSFFFLLAQFDAGQPGMSHHRQGDMPIPTVPEAHFRRIQPRLPFGLFDALLHRVAAGGHAHQRLK